MVDIANSVLSRLPLRPPRQKQLLRRPANTVSPVPLTAQTAALTAPTSTSTSTTQPQETVLTGSASPSPSPAAQATIPLASTAPSPAAKAATSHLASPTGQPASSACKVTRLRGPSGYDPEDPTSFRDALFEDYKKLEKEYRQAGVSCYAIVGKDKQGNPKFHSIQYPSPYHKQE